jgi:hypothetical protein
MSLYQFILLDEMEQAEILWEHGVMIANREEEETKYILYQLDKFYIEVQYHKEQNLLKGLTPFENMNRLSPYLDKINIEDL